MLARVYVPVLHIKSDEMKPFAHVRCAMLCRSVRVTAAMPSICPNWWTPCTFGEVQRVLMVWSVSQYVQVGKGDGNLCVRQVPMILFLHLN